VESPAGPPPVQQPPPAPTRPPPGPPPSPLDADFVEGATRNPVRAIDLVLTEPRRVGASVAAGATVGRIALVFLLTSILFALPYGCVLSLAGWWKVVVLVLGSTAICLPSLHVFSGYLGQRLRLEQILVLGLTIPAVAAVFTLGFAPILAFLRATMSGEETEIPWQSVSTVMLTLAVLAGVVQLWRTWLAARAAGSSGLFTIVLLVWHAVFLHVILRMGSVLRLGE